MKSFSLILSTIKAHKELNLCLESLSLNSKLANELIVIVDRNKKGEVNRDIINVLDKRKVNFLLNNKNLGPYASWNAGAKKAKKDILCFITDDQYFVPGWDEGIMKYMRENLIISSQLVEPGVLPPSFQTFIKDFGERAENFQKQKFLEYARKIKQNKLTDGEFFIPLAIYKKDFFRLGGFPTGGDFGVKSMPNDVLFVKKAIKQGVEFKTSLASVSYHFQASSWEKHKKLRKWKNKIKLFLKKQIPILRERKIGKWEQGKSL